MKKYNKNMALLVMGGMLCLGGAVMDSAISGEHGKHFSREDRHEYPFSGKHDKGTETVGQIVAWLLAVANLPVAASVLIKYTLRFAPMADERKKSLADINRMQKKAFMWIHYYLNLGILGIALWHWMSSRCRASALPELGFLLMAVLIVSGFLMKFKLCPTAFRKSVYQLHTQPTVFVTMILVLTVGHALVD